MIVKSNLPPSAQYQQAIDDGLIVNDPAQRQVLTELDRIFHALLEDKNTPWYQFWKQPDAIVGLYMWGGVGTGKTLLMDMLHQSLPAAMAYRIHFHRFMHNIHHAKAALTDTQNPIQKVIDDLLGDCRILCLDEFVVTDITDAMILSSVLEQIFAKNIVLVTTSNTRSKDLYQDQLQRERFLPAIALLQAHTLECNIDSGRDYRMQYLKDSEIYHYPLDSAAVKLMQTTYGHLAGPYQDARTSILLSDREVTVIAASSGVLWIEFDEICLGFRSRMDYIDISKRFHSVLLANVPQMDNMMDDAARRFIELVDELYDRHVDLIITAAVSADELYVGKRLQAPFARTISRLHEMSSQEYLALAHLA